jgi:hypothetical protein
MNKKWIFALILIFSTSLSLNGEKILNYNEWFKTLHNDSEDAYFIYKDTFVCWEKDQYVHAYNDIIGNRNGNYNKDVIRRFTGCQMLQGYSIARIIKTYKGSNVVQVEYQRPFTDGITKDHIHMNQLKTIKDHYAQMIN